MSGTPIQFGPTPNGRQYFILPKHRNRTPGASQWHVSVPPLAEFDLFVKAEVNGWQDSKGNYWSVRADGAPVGTANERIAKHPNTINQSDPWHGYPASPVNKGDGDAPDDDLVERWASEQAVTRSFARRLQRRQI